MMPYRHILFATALTPMSSKIGLRARELADKYQAVLSCVHAYDTLTSYYGGDATPIINQELLEEHKQQVEDAMSKLTSELNIAEKDSYLIANTTKRAILDTAVDTQADLIVLGSHVYHGIDAFLSSTAQTVLHHAPCDIYVIRE